MEDKDQKLKFRPLSNASRKATLGIIPILDPDIKVDYATIGVNISNL
ncbi:MAG: hypothetical protein SXA11_05905 [Cyanobacteriota bacterium]|nr:hypothetical protein [Cyanobacteriota bacterium]